MVVTELVSVWQNTLKHLFTASCTYSSLMFVFFQSRYAMALFSVVIVKALTAHEPVAVTDKPIIINSEACCSRQYLIRASRAELPTLRGSLLIPWNQIKNAFGHWSPDAPRLIAAQKATLCFCVFSQGPFTFTMPYKYIDPHGHSRIHMNH